MTEATAAADISSNNRRNDNGGARKRRQGFLFLTTLSLLALAVVMTGGEALAQSAFRITGETKTQRDRMVRLTAEGMAAGSGLIWDFDEEKLDVEESGSRLLLVGPPGVYQVKCRAIRVQDGKTLIETARVKVVIGGEPGPPVPPPVPPTPPVPPVPPPDDALTRSLKDAYSVDDGADKAKNAKALAAFYRAAASTAKDEKLKTAGDLHAVLKKAVDSFLPTADALVAVRVQIQAATRKVLPTAPSEALTTDHRVQAAGLFLKVADILEGLAKS